MKIAIMAAGAVGGYFGARLAAGGHEVGFVARGAHLEAMRAGGLEIESALGDITVDAVNAAADAAAIGPADVVLFAVKLWDTETAAATCTPLIKEGTAVISLQNGVAGGAALAAALGADHALNGAAFIASAIARPGVIHHTGTMARLVFGETDNRASERVQAFAKACSASGIEAAVAKDSAAAIWEKFVFLAALSGTTAAARLPIGGILADARRKEQFAAAIEETAAVGRARGVTLAADLGARTLDFAAGLPPEMKSSTLHDLEAGRRLESPWLSGAVSRMGQAAGVPTPVHDALLAAVAD